jgi:hypothetical protein
MTNEYPKVLVLTANSIRPSHSDGWTQYNLFRGWPADRLAQIYYDGEPPEQSVCATSWKIGLEDVPLDRLLRRGLRLLGAGAVHGPDGTVMADFGRPQKPSWTVSMKTHLKQAARAWMDWRSSFRVTDRLLHWARAFHPDVVYCFPAKLRPVRFQSRISDELGVPLLPHFLDDWLSQMYRNNWLENGPRQALSRGVIRQLRRCSFALAISPAMAAEYARRFDKPFFALSNCVEVPPVWPEPPPENGGRPYSLAYVGGLHMGRFESLLETAAVVRNLRDKGIPVEIVCYELRESQAQRAALAQTGVVKLAGALPRADAVRRLQEASVLLQLEPFDQAAVAYLKLSSSGKLPLYLASGRATLIRGAAGLFSLEYMLEHHAAVAVTDPRPELLQGALRVLLTNRAMRLDLGRSAWHLARAKHNAPGQRERFRSFLAAAAARRIPDREQ